MVEVKDKVLRLQSILNKLGYKVTYKGIQSDYIRIHALKGGMLHYFIIPKSYPVWLYNEDWLISKIYAKDIIYEIVNEVSI